MLVFQSLTNKKNTKTYSTASVIAGPTSGEFKLTPMAAEKVGVKEGDNLAVVVAEVDGVKKVFIGKGINGVPVLDKDGQQLKTITGKKVHEPGTSFGATLGAQENSVLLKCSAQAGWDTLGGSSSTNLFFDIEDGVEGQVPTGNKDGNGEDIMHISTFYGLVFNKKVDKAARKEQKKEGENKENDIVAPLGKEFNTEDKGNLEKEEIIEGFEEEEEEEEV